VFTATSNPVYVEFSKSKKAKASLVLALLRSGSVGVWQFNHKADREASASSRKPDTLIKVVRSTGAPDAEQDDKKKKKSKGKAGQVLFAQFTGEHEILIAYGTAMRPVFERVVRSLRPRDSHRVVHSSDLTRVSCCLAPPLHLTEPAERGNG
jgi:hypothetical protein